MSAYAANSGVQNWNHYVRRNDTTTLCTGVEGSENACIHAGQIRKVETYFTSCPGISLSDNLGAFDWECSLVSGYAVFTGSLKSQKSLVHLVNSSGTAFNSNFVTLTYTSGSTSVTWTSSPLAWWSNTVNPLAGRVTLSTEGEVVVVPSTTSTAGIQIDADRVSLLVGSGQSLSWTSSSPANCGISGSSTASLRCLIHTSGKKFLWIEGSFSGTSMTAGAGAERLLSLYNTRNTRVQGARFSTAAPSTILPNEGHCLSIEDSQRVSIQANTTLTNCSSGAGLDLKNSSYSTVDQLGSARNGKYGILVRDGSRSNRFSEITVAANEMIGIKLSLAGTGNTFDEVSSYSNGLAGFYSMGTPQITVSRSYFVGNGTSLPSGAGMVFVHGSGHRILATTSAMNIGDGIRFEQQSEDITPILYSSGLTAAGKVTQTVLHNYVAYLNSSFAINTSYMGDSGVCFGYPGEDETSCNGIAMGLWTSYLIDRLLFSQMVISRNGFGISYGGARYANSSTFTTAGFLTGALSAPGFPTSGAGTITAHLNVTQADLTTGSFSGKVTTDDTVSTSDSTGSATVASLFLGTSWLLRENFARIWQKDWATSNPTSADDGACAVSGTCRLSDWSLRTTDTVLLNKTGVGAGASTSNSAPSSGSCPSEVAGNESIVFSAGCSKENYTTDVSCVSAGGTWYPEQVFLKNAVELVDSSDSDNDKDGLCESNETCLYTPNFGAYQGHGSTSTCTFSGTASSTTVGNVMMNYYVTNGR